MITCRVLAGCTVADNSKDGNLPNITLRFRTDLLKDDAVMVMDPLMNALAMTDPNSGWSAGGRPSDLLASLGPPKLCCRAVRSPPCSIDPLPFASRCPHAAMLLCCTFSLCEPTLSRFYMYWSDEPLTLSWRTGWRVRRAVLATAD